MQRAVRVWDESLCANDEASEQSDPQASCRLRRFFVCVQWPLLSSRSLLLLRVRFLWQLHVPALRSALLLAPMPTHAQGDAMPQIRRVSHQSSGRPTSSSPSASAQSSQTANALLVRQLSCYEAQNAKQAADRGQMALVCSQIVPPSIVRTSSLPLTQGCSLFKTRKWMNRSRSQRPPGENMAP